MDKPEVLVGTLEEEFTAKLLSYVGPGPDGKPMSEEITSLVTEFKTNLEAEAWQAFELAQSFSMNAERHQLEEDKARHRDRVDSYNKQVRAFRKHVAAHNEKHNESQELPEEETPA